MWSRNGRYLRKKQDKCFEKNLCFICILQSSHSPQSRQAGGGLDGPKGHQLMTSVSVPVYKKKNHKVGFSHSHPDQFQNVLSCSQIGQICFGNRYEGTMNRCPPRWKNQCKSVQPVTPSSQPLYSTDHICDNMEKCNSSVPTISYRFQRKLESPFL